MRNERQRRRPSFKAFTQLSIGRKKQEFVRWLMRRGVPLGEAKLICWKKFRRRDPFEANYDE